MANTGDLNQKIAIEHFIDDSIVADANSICILRPTQLADSTRIRIGRQ